MNFWYPNSHSHSLFGKIFILLLLPFTLLFWFVSCFRRALFISGLAKSYRSPVPVVIVGNLSVGGNGKTPVVVWLVQQLQARGIKCGVISRGYGSQSDVYPLLVTAETDPVKGGDEPVLIAKRTGVPVCISPNRQQGIELLLANNHCDVIISDDGLQHYKLQRDVEIVVMDAERGLGNGFTLPAGPLRETAGRLQNVDLIIGNGGENQYTKAKMQLVPRYAINLVTKEKRILTEFKLASALAGIGNPQRFFTMLQGLGIQLEKAQAFQDHQKFSAEQFSQFDDNIPLLMTEKDAVKCGQFAQQNWWYVPVEAEILGENVTALLDKIVALAQNYQEKNQRS